jgi:hypothetical protein
MASCPFMAVVVIILVAVVVAEHPAHVVHGALVPQGPLVQPDHVADGQAPVLSAWFHQLVHGPEAQGGVLPEGHVVGKPVLGQLYVLQPDHCEPQALGMEKPAPNGPYPLYPPGPAGPPGYPPLPHPGEGAVVMVVNVLPAESVSVTGPVVVAVATGPIPPAPKGPQPEYPVKLEPDAHELGYAEPPAVAEYDASGAAVME